MSLTRRQRHERILENFGPDRVARLIHNELSTTTILMHLSDDGIELVARRLVSGYRLQQRYNRENRERVRARQA